MAGGKKSKDRKNRKGRKTDDGGSNKHPPSPPRQDDHTGTVESTEEDTASPNQESAGRTGSGSWLGASWPRTLAMVGLGMALQAGIGALLLKGAGVTDVQSLNDFLENSSLPSGVSEFLQNSALPQVENGLAMFNRTTRLRGWGEGGNEPNLDRPGRRLANEGAKAKYPIVIVPGFVTSGLELWGGEECAQKHFRTRLWGSLSMAQTFVADRDCWRRHLSLDPFTGSDPPNIRIRAAQGFEAADYFMSTFWVFGKIIENLADVGYDGSNMVMMSYDWRLAFPILEERDGYLTRLRFAVEAYHHTTGEKAIIISHSMGGSLILYFLKWITTDKEHGGGGGGEDWVEKHVHSFVNIAGTLLGVPKAVPALLSGELKDTAMLLGAIGNMLEQYFGRTVRKDLWSTWGSLWQMLPKGGSAIWGVGADLCDAGDTMEGLLCQRNLTSKEAETEALNRAELAQTDPPMVPLVSMLNSSCDNELESNIIDNLPTGEANSTARPKTSPADTCPSREVVEKIQHLASTSSWSAEDTIDFLLQWGGGYGPQLSSPKLHSFDSRSKGQSLQKEQWHNPTVTPLPYAPSLKIYCFYGFGIPTERGYFYKKACNSNHNGIASTAPGQNANDPLLIMDTSVNDAENNITVGVRFADGDVSVPLLSLGYMCVDGWKGRNGLNPSGMEVVTREYKHASSFQANDPIRGGPRSGEHCDILGNDDMVEDVLKVATNFDSMSMQTRILSDIERVAERINAHPLGGLKAAKAGVEDAQLGGGE